MGFGDIWVRKFPQEEVELILVRWVIEVVEEVPRDGLLAVIELSGGGDLAGSGELHLERSGTGVQHADSVSVLSPVVSEDHFEVSRKLLERHSVWLQDAACLSLDANVQCGVESEGCFLR